jgi:hypothetical protein
VTDLEDRFQRYVERSVTLLGADLIALLNRAYALGVVICPSVSPEGISYSMEWAFGGEHRYMDVDWDHNTSEWKIT